MIFAFIPVIAGLAIMGYCLWGVDRIVLRTFSCPVVASRPPCLRSVARLPSLRLGQDDNVQIGHRLYRVHPKQVSLKATLIGSVAVVTETVQQRPLGYESGKHLASCSPPAVLTALTKGVQ